MPILIAQKAYAPELSRKLLQSHITTVSKLSASIQQAGQFLSHITMVCMSKAQADGGTMRQPCIAILGGEPTLDVPSAFGLE